MATVTKTVEDAVNPLIEICRDGEKGFAAAADAVSDNTLKQELLRFSRERAGFADALADALESYGLSPSTHGSASGAIRRGWISLMKIKPGDNEHVVLAACEREEDSAVEAYGEAATSGMSGQLANLIANQYQVVKSTHDRIRDLRDMADRG